MIRWWRARRRRRWCFHHDHRAGTTWIRSQIIDGGRKMWWCAERLGGCGRTWFI